MVFGWIKGRGAGGYRTLAGPVTRFTVARTTMRDAGPSRAKDGDGVMAEHPSNPGGLSEVWHSKIEKPKFKLGQLFEFMTKWHTLTWNTHGNACKNYKGSAQLYRVRGAWLGCG